MKNLTKLIATATLLLTAGISSAQNTGTVRFIGSINANCNLSAFMDGTIVVDSAGGEFSSTNQGGSPAMFRAATNSSNFRLMFGQPVLTGPNGTVSNATYTITSSASGSMGILNGLLNQLNLGIPGVYNVTVNATATLPSGNAYESGNYTLQVPVSCAK